LPLLLSRSGPPPLLLHGGHCQSDDYHDWKNRKLTLAELVFDALLMFPAISSAMLVADATKVYSDEFGGWAMNWLPRAAGLVTIEKFADIVFVVNICVWS